MDTSKPMSEEDVKKLIRWVERKPCIWDKSCNKDSAAKKTAWREICQKFVEDYEDEEEMKRVEDMLFAKWKNVRDAYKKSKNNSTQHYKYYDFLKFLKKNDSPESQSSTPEPQSGPSNYEPQSSVYTKRSSSSSPQLTIKRARPSSVSKVKTEVISPPPKNIRLETPPPDYETSKTNLNQRNITDEDEAFFISIMPNVKKFSSDDKLDFRIRVLQAIKEINQKSKTQAEVQMNPNNSGIRNEPSTSTHSSAENLPNGDFVQIKEEICMSD